MTSTPADSCVFCGIIAGQLPVSQVYQDDQTVAFLDVRPLTSGHLLVVPRVHAASLEILDEDTGTLVFAVAHRLARALRKSAVPCEGVNFFLADGVAAGQEVFHVHLHVIPRTPGDGFRLKARPRTPGRDELDSTAERVRAGMKPARLRPGFAICRNAEGKPERSRGRPRRPVTRLARDDACR